MSETIDDLTIEYVEGDLVKVKQLDKVVLTRGAWSTIMYKFQDWNNAKQEYGPEKYSIRRYQKRNGKYMKQSHFNISNKEQAQKIIDALLNWMKD